MLHNNILVQNIILIAELHNNILLNNYILQQIIFH